MIEASWLLFVVASLVLIVTPGQDMILVMSRSIAQGAAAGVATAAGVSVGLVGHTVLATLGLGAILRTSEWLFVGAQARRCGLPGLPGRAAVAQPGAHELAVAAGAPRSLWRLFFDGALSNVSNPKIAVFYFAFLPQFVPPRRGASDAVGVRARPGVRRPHVRGQGASRPGRRACCRRGFVRVRRRWPGCYRISGAVLIGLGLKLALERRA